MRKCVQECRDLHFDAVELPDACADMLPETDYLRLLDDLQEVFLLGSNYLLLKALAQMHTCGHKGLPAAAGRPAAGDMV